MNTFTCIVCPEGCTVTADGAGNITGNKCRRGAAYVRSELTDPRRNLSTTVAVTGGNVPVVPVKTAAPIPKGMIFPCMKALKTVVLQAPVSPGDVVLPDVSGTGIAVLVTGSADIPRK